MTPAQIKDIVEQVRQGNQVNMINEVTKQRKHFEKMKMLWQKKLELDTETKELKDEI